MTLVVDASVVVAALVDAGKVGTWASAVLVDAPLAAPHHMPAEVANVLRRRASAGTFSQEVASLAHADLRELRVRLFPYEVVAGRAWDLRENLTLYDAWYVALAEELGAELVTLDARLSRARGLRCSVRLPPGR